LPNGRINQVYAQLEPYGLFILIALLITGVVGMVI